MDRFGGWDVDVHQPWRRSVLGFDTVRLAVDLVVGPDGDWAWKDRDDLDDLAAAGALAAAHRNLALREGLFAPAWTTWAPEAEPPRLALPDDWAITT